MQKRTAKKLCMVLLFVGLIIPNSLNAMEGNGQGDKEERSSKVTTAMKYCGGIFIMCVGMSLTAMAVMGSELLDQAYPLGDRAIANIRCSILDPEKRAEDQLNLWGYHTLKRCLEDGVRPFGMLTTLFGGGYICYRAWEDLLKD